MSSADPSPHSHAFTEANRTFFNDLAATYDLKPWQQKAAQQATTAIQDNLAFIRIPSSTSSQQDETPPHNDNDKQSTTTATTLLDYASGTGMISRALGPSVSAIRAIDLSSHMVARYNELAPTSEVASVRAARAVVGDLLADHRDDAATSSSSVEGEGKGDGEQEGKGEGRPIVDLEGPDFYGFSIVAVGLGVHHFHDPGEAIGRLARRVRKGGVLLILDFVEEEDVEKEADGEGGRGKGEQKWVASEADRTIRKRGFSEGEMRGLMLREGNGLGEFGWRVMPERIEIRMQENNPVYRMLFLARATKVS